MITRERCIPLRARRVRNARGTAKRAAVADNAIKIRFFGPMFLDVGFFICEKGVFRRKRP